PAIVTLWQQKSSLRRNARPMSYLSYFRAAALKGPPDRLVVCRAREQRVSRGKFIRFQRATAGFTTRAFDGYGLRGHLPARPALYVSDPVLVHGLAPLLRASFRPRLTATSLRFAITSRPSRCEEDLHLLAGDHARHTRKGPAVDAGPGTDFSFEVSRSGLQPRAGFLQALNERLRRFRRIVSWFGDDFLGRGTLAIQASVGICVG